MALDTHTWIHTSLDYTPLKQLCLSKQSFAAQQSVYIRVAQSLACSAMAPILWNGLPKKVRKAPCISIIPQNVQNRNVQGGILKEIRIVIYSKA